MDVLTGIRQIMVEKLFLLTGLIYSAEYIQLTKPITAKSHPYEVTRNQFYFNALFVTISHIQELINRPNDVLPFSASFNLSQPSNMFSE